ncbi:MAG: hypothetical protein LBJ41_02845 [Treponema sp.]|jgi:hypothetical protein|nr:hypothetical protein [Treponema sp.]
MAKNKVLLGMVAAATLAILTGCPTEVVSEGGEDYIRAAVLVNEKAKYETAVSFYFDASDADTDVTDQVIRLIPGKIANRDIVVSVDSTDESGYFALRNGRIFFTGTMPPVEENFVKEEDPVSEPKDEETIGRGISNGEVITLSFQKDTETTTLDVLGVIKKKGTENDPERIAVSEENTFLLYGYDVIKSSYINRSDVKMGHPILDVNKVNTLDLVRQSATTSSFWESASGESVKELFESLNASASVAYKGALFSGKVSAEFSTSSSSKQIVRYAKGRGFQITKEEFLRQTSPSVLKNLLDNTFKDDIMEQSASYILATYGTHLIARSYWGGEAEFNYSYTGTELKNDQDIKAALNASYGGFNGEASVENKKNAQELNSNSTFFSSSRGGANTSWVTAEQFTAGYADWVQTVKNQPDLCGIPNFNNDLIPIWSIAKEVSSTRAALIEQEFNKIASAQGVALDGYKYVPPAPVYSYVTDINVIEQRGDGVPSGYTNLVKTDMYNPNGGGVLDANQGAGGAWIRIPYKIAQDNNHNAIAEIRVVNTGGSGSAPNNAGWNTISFDLNKGAGGPYLWLLYRKVNASDTKAIDFIGCYSGSSAGSSQILSGYEWAGGRVDLNTSAGGAWLYLTVRKVPFTW